MLARWAPDLSMRVCGARGARLVRLPRTSASKESLWLRHLAIPDPARGTVAVPPGAAVVPVVAVAGDVPNPVAAPGGSGPALVVVRASAAGRGRAADPVVATAATVLVAVARAVARGTAATGP